MALPPRFPCWCQATYSWGGENKKDLGFIEGDLIEALNAGDGLWWTGRLRRDPRAIGSFPSNFVKVLDESFQPAPNSRNASPRDTPPRQLNSPTKQKSVFRKPFQAYGVVGANGSREGTPESDKEKPKREKSKFRPYSSMKTAQAPNSSGSPVKKVQNVEEFKMPAPPPRMKSRSINRAPSPRPVEQENWTAERSSFYEPQYHSRAPSPAPSRPTSPLPVSYHDGSPYPQLIPSRTPSPQPPHHDYSRSASPLPPRQDYDRPASPQPPHHQYYSRPASPFDDYAQDDSPAPPPPPAHRVLYQSRPASPHMHDNTPQNIPRSPSGSHMTPSPLRDAMNEVMSSLQDMSMEANDYQEQSSNVWSPDEFELTRKRSQASQSISRSYGQEMHPQNDYSMSPPTVPLKGSHHSRQASRPTTASSQSSTEFVQRNLSSRKSAYELGARERLNRTYTTKTNATNSTETSSATQSSTSTQLTSRSIMSGYSAGGFSATSAGSLARRKFGLGSQKRNRPLSMLDTRSVGDLKAASDFSGSGPSYHDSHASNDQEAENDSAGVFGGLSLPKKKKSGFFRKMIENAKTTAMTGAATARATVSRPGSRAGSPTKNKEMVGFGGGTVSRPSSSTSASKDLSSGSDWMQVRRDVNRSNSLSHKEKEDRHDRCEMLDLPAFRPVDAFLEQIEGDESLDGLAVMEPTDFNTPNLALVDKSARFVNSVPSMISPAALAQSYLCRPYRSDVQRLRAIFTWVAERISWEDDFEGELNSRRVIQARRGCSEEIALLVQEMCAAVGLHVEMIRGYLKAPGETPDPDSLARGNHWWNAVIVDGEWRILDAALASPSHPRRSDYSGASSQAAENWYFLARPTEICYTHIALLPEQQHIVPAIQHEILAALPCACPAYFRHELELSEFDTSILHLEGLEMAHLHVFVPEDIECVAEIEARAYATDTDGDVYESDDVIVKQALTQPEWISGRKRVAVKALLPPNTTTGTVKIYAGKRGLMHSVKDNPHNLAFALPITHSGQNAAYDFVTRHPTPHAQRHDLYVAQPQCSKLVMNNTFVFSIRQHPSALSRFTPDTWGGSSNRPSSPAPGTPFARPGSAMSMRSAAMSISATGSQYSDTSSSAGSGSMTNAQLRPAKLAIQSPSQKIIRLTRKSDPRIDLTGESNQAMASTWETIIKIGEKGIWRGLVLADRSARWCVFAEWECI